MGPGNLHCPLPGISTTLIQASGLILPYEAFPSQLPAPSLSWDRCPSWSHMALGILLPKHLSHCIFNYFFCFKFSLWNISNIHKRSSNKIMNPTYPPPSFNNYQLMNNFVSSISSPTTPPTSDYFEANPRLPIILSVNTSLCFSKEESIKKKSITIITTKTLTIIP